MLADGHDVPTAELANPAALEQEAIHAAEDVYERDVGWIEESDCMVAEVSTPSHGVGYEIAYALDRGKPVLCLYQQDVKVSKMLTGNSQATLQIRPYKNSSEALLLMTDFLSRVAAE